MLAQHFGWYYLSTGLLYRAVGYLLVRDFRYNETTLADPKHEDLMACVSGLEYEYRDGVAVVLHKGREITADLKTKDVDRYASIIAANVKVRHEMLQLQRVLVQGKSIVVEGRDIGSVVLPHADVKFFITASLPERARRWQQDQAGKGKQYSFAEAEGVVAERDHRDETRVHSPMKISPEAYVIDNTHLNQKETLQRMVEIINAYKQRL
jgi:cytidylate kinase